MERAALSLIVSVVSPIITKLGDLTVSYFGGDITQLEIDQLKCVNIPHILTVIQAGENIKTEILKPWLMKLKDIAYEAEDLLDIYAYKRIEDESSSSPFAVKMLKTKAKELLSPVLPKTALRSSFEKIQQSADEAKRLSELLQLVCITSTAQNGSTVNRQSTTVSGMSSTVFGRDGERNYLISLLTYEQGQNISMSNDSSSRKRISVYSLYGIGGAGKTTLVQYIYNDERVKSHFDERIWIEVTHNFNAEKITREIIHCINRNAPPSSCETLNLLQIELKQILSSKKLLLVLDNIWCEEKELWDKLLIPFNEVGLYGSKILITTRSEEIGLALNVNINIPLQELTDDHCWSILMDHAFGHSKKSTIDLELAAIAKKIIPKLKRSPLALRIVGSLLGKKIDAKEWEQILKQDMLKETRDVIYFSFQNLPMHLQCCFAYCSLYPKGFRFTLEFVKYLVRQWIAVGFVKPLSGSLLTLEELGMKYFDALVSYSFFQKSHVELLPRYKMHDLLHDLAEMVSKDSCFRIENEEQSSIPETIKHLSISTYKEGIVRIRDILNLVNLRTFMVHSMSDTDCKILVIEFDEVCKKLTKLRVLYFFKCVKIQGLSSIGKMKHLRYLELYHVKELPESLSKLYHLQYLIGHPGLSTISKSFSNLVNLRRLQQLHGSLTIKNLQNVSSEVDAIKARVNQKSYLSELSLKWDKDQKTKVSTDTCEVVLEGLEPHPNLKVLKIKHYMGSKAPQWMVFLPNLQILTLSSCQNLMDLHYLPHHLQILQLEDCPNLNQLSSFPFSLVRLDIINCPKFEDTLWLLTELNSLTTLRIAGFSHIQILPDLNPLLENLDIVNFPELICIGNFHSLTSLIVLTVSACPKLTAYEKGDLLPFRSYLCIDKPPLLIMLLQQQGLNSLLELAVKNYLRDEPFTHDFFLLISLKSPHFNDLINPLSLSKIFKKLTCREKLHVYKCSKIVFLPDMPLSLENLCIRNCPRFKYLPSSPFL